MSRHSVVLTSGLLLLVPRRVTYLAETEQRRIRLPGNLVARRTSFNVSLKEFGVRDMEGAVGPKVSDTIEIDVSFFATSRRRCNRVDDPGQTRNTIEADDPD